MAVSLTGVLTGAILLSITMSVPVGNQSQFSVMLFFTALFIPFSSANVIATVYDITLPEVRSTALAVQYFIENGGAALAPLIAGIIARATNLHTAILTICVAAWLIASLLLAFTAVYVPNDIQTLRDQLHERAEIEMASSAA